MASTFWTLWTPFSITVCSVLYTHIYIEREREREKEREKIQSPIHIFAEEEKTSHLATVVFDIIDYNGDGHLSFDEFIDWLMGAEDEETKAAGAEANKAGVESCSTKVGHLCTI